jgi:6-phosphogluconate dehydrogenase
MGANITRRLMRARHQCVVYDIKRESIAPLVEAGAVSTKSLQELVDILTRRGLFG